MASWELGLIFTAIYTVGILGFTAGIVWLAFVAHHPTWPKRVRRWDHFSSSARRLLHEAKSHEAMERIVRASDWESTK